MHNNSSKLLHEVHTFPLRTWQLSWYIMIFIFGVTGNLTVCLVICRSGSRLLYRVPFNKYLLSLAVADLMVSLFAIPIYVLSTSYFNHPSSTAGIILCKTVTGYMFPFWMANVSVFTLVAIGSERLCALNRSMSINEDASEKRTNISIVVVWIAAFIIQLPTIIGETYDPKYQTIGNFCAFTYPAMVLNVVYPVIFVLEYMIPFSLLVFVFLRIRKSLLHLNKLLSESLTSNFCMERHQEVMKRRHKTVWLLFLITTAFFVMWTPNKLCYFLFQYTAVSEIHWNSEVYQAAVLLGFSNSCVNPFLYALQSNELRSHCREMFINCCSCSNDEEHEEQNSELRDPLLAPA